MTRLTAGGGKSYVYDAENRLVEVKNSAGSTIAAYEYDALGRRTGKTVSGVTTKFYYDGDSTRVLYETDGSNNIVAQFTYDSNGKLISMTRGGATYYYQFNARGDVVALTDASGAVVNSYDYDAYGIVISKTGTVQNPYLYASYRYDEETGLYYLNARYYAPELGRFVTRDSVLGFEDDPQTLNLYTYGKGNPIKFFDPSGYLPFALPLDTTSGQLLIKAILFATAVSLAVTKAIDLMKTWENRYRDNPIFREAWVAGGKVQKGNKLSITAAITRAKAGFGVFASDKNLAYTLAFVAGGAKKPEGPEIHGAYSGYRYHYHPYGHGAHIWY